MTAVETMTVSGITKYRSIRTVAGLSGVITAGIFCMYPSVHFSLILTFLRCLRASRYTNHIIIISTNMKNVENPADPVIMHTRRLDIITMLEDAAT
jgi:hypothetical protein